LVGPEQKAIGFDGMHRPNDKLWKGDAVQSYLHKGRLLLSEEERKQRKKRRNASYYSQKRGKRDEILSLHQEGKISEAEANKRLMDLNLNIGWYRTAAENSGILNEFSQLLHHFPVFYGCIDDPMVSRIPYEWPTEPGEDTFICLAVALVPLKPLLKMRDPFEPKFIRMLKTLLHPQLDHLSHWLTKDDKTRLLSLLNGSISTVTEKYRTKAEQKVFVRRWNEALSKAILELAPVSETMPSFVWRFAVHFAFRSLIALDKLSGSESGLPLRGIRDLEELGSGSDVDTTVENQNTADD
jgi:hypothetical protein